MWIVSLPVLTRENVLGYRAWAHGLDRRPGGTETVLGLGLQDTPHGSARSALLARAAAGSDPDPASAGLVTVWSWRGAPHLHHRTDPGFLAAALWPVSDADARKRISVTAIKEGARRGLAAFTEAASAMRAVVTERLLKGEVSTLVSERIPADLTFECATCRARHISGALFQQVGLAAGVQVETEGRSSFLSPLPEDIRPKRVPTRASGTSAALLRYVEALAPASPAQLAAFLGTTQAAITQVLPAGLIEVSGPAGRGWVPDGALARLSQAGPPRLTRLLPPSDPWLQARDRELVIPDPGRRKAVWGVIGNPGVVLVDGEVVGTWRARTQRARLVLTVDAFVRVSRTVRAEIEAEATLLATSRAVPASEVVFAG
jgi:winged helix DNA-binding protein